MNADNPLARWPNLDDLFDQALDHAPEAREEFLDRVCGGDSDLRRELTRLLEACDPDDAFLDRGQPWLGELTDLPPTSIPAAALPSLEPGRAIGHYEIESLLGAGGMGVVYRARDTRLGRVVALKFLQPHLVADPDARARFIDEARAASALDHANICTVYEINETDDGQVFIAMGYYAGETLRARIARGALPPADGLRIASAIADGLARAHEAGIVHRDLKPANVMLTERGEVKLLDFGIAKLEGGADVTQPGAHPGTAAYMSPEQARGDPVDHRTDIWSLGVVLYEILSGRRPFPGRDPAAVTHKVLNDDPAPLEEIPSDLHPGITTILDRSLVRDPSHRYDTMVAMLDALKAVAGGATPAPAPAHRGRRGPRRRVAWLTAATGAAVLGWTWFAAARGRSPDPAAPPVETPPVLLVLPFENLGEAADDYFAEGVTEEIVQRLSTLPSVRVLARTTAAQIARSGDRMAAMMDSLSITYVLEGTVRWSHTPDGVNRVRISSRFVRVRDGAVVWAAPMDGEVSDIFRLQADIAERVATGLQIRLAGPQRRSMRAAGTSHPGAYDAYLQGIYHLGRRTAPELRRAVGQFNRAIALDSGYAEAWAGLANSYALFPFRQMVSPPRDESTARAQEAARRALALDETNAEAHMALGFVLLTNEWNTDAAKTAFQRAIQLSPQYAQAHHNLSLVLKMEEQTEAALQSIARAVELDPLSANINTNYGWHLMLANRPAEAIPYLVRAIELSTDYFWPNLNLGAAHIALGNWNAAREPWRAALRIQGMDSVAGETVVAGIRPGGQARERAYETLDQWGRESTVSPVQVAWFFHALSAADHAVTWLVRGHSVRDANPIDLVVLLQRHRGDARAVRTLRELGLP